MTARTTTKLPSTALTRQEKTVLDLLCTGASNQEIAQALIISVRTATTHLCNISNKLQISGRVRLVLYWQIHRPTEKSITDTEQYRNDLDQWFNTAKISIFTTVTNT